MMTLRGFLREAGHRTKYEGVVGIRRKKRGAF